MFELIALALMLEDVSLEVAHAFAVIVTEQQENNTAFGDPILQARGAADLNGDSLIDCVVVFTYSLGGGIHGQVQFLSVIASSPVGYVASWPVSVGARGYRDFNEVVIDGTAITLRGDFSVADETASMAYLPATGEVYYSYEDGKLREQGGSWARKPDQ